VCNLTGRRGGGGHYELLRYGKKNMKKCHTCARAKGVVNVTTAGVQRTKKRTREKKIEKKPGEEGGDS